MKIPKREECTHAPVCKHDDGMCPTDCGYFDSVREDPYVQKLVAKNFADLLEHDPESLEGIPCLGCAMADTLLHMAVIATRERLIRMDNAEHDKVFKKIEKYLKDKYPTQGGCPALD